MNVLIACEISGVIRDAFRMRGHNAWSCDLFGIKDVPPHWPEQRYPAYHLQGDALPLLAGALDWDLLIAMPPCTYLANSGVRWLVRGGKHINPNRWAAMREAANLFNAFLRAPAKHICVENPVMHGHASRLIDYPFTQSFHPWQFWGGRPGQGEVKRTCLHLKGLPKLVPTTPNEPGRITRVHSMGPSKYRQMDRSLTPIGLAHAMAEQWGALQ
jgi:hypothetical protein